MTGRVPAERAQKGRGSALTWGLVVIVAAATIALAILGNGNPAAALVPTLAIVGLAVLWVLPIRFVLLGLTFCILIFETRYESWTTESWRSPMVPPGMILLERLNTFINLKALRFALIDVILLFLLVIVAHRSMTGSTVDTDGRVRSPVEMTRWALVSLAGAFLSLGWGLATGGEFRFGLWQITRTLYLPVLLILYQYGLRGPKDWKRLSQIIILAACIKAVLALYVRMRILEPPLGSAFATTHSDSMLFATAGGMILSQLFVNYGRESLLRALRIFPLIGAGMWANNRRLAWVELAGVLLLLFGTTPTNKFKRFLVAMVPVAALYVLIGWNIDSGIFAPVKMIRSTVDAKTDASTLWREMENFNLVYTASLSPLLGLGYGHGYHEVIKLPDISAAFELYRHLPHNSLLGLAAFGGFIGFTAQWMLFSVGVFFAVLSYRRSKDRDQRAASLAAAGSVVVYFVQCYGDLGLGSWTGVILVASLLAMAGKFSVVARTEARR